MTANSSFIMLLFQLVFYLTAESSHYPTLSKRQRMERHKINKRYELDNVAPPARTKMVFYLNALTPCPTVELESITFAKKVNNALAEMDLPEKTKEAFSKQWIYVGRYSIDFIELLNSLETTKDSPIRFNDHEKRILSSSNAEDSTNDKALAQLKYFCKMQEVQCTDHFLLYNILNETNRNMQPVLQRVRNMIEMAYVGLFVVYTWLWKLYINLLSLNKFIYDTTVADLEQYRKPLGELVNMCVENNYIANSFLNKNANDTEKMLFTFNSFDDKRHIHFNNNKSPLPLSIPHLFLSYMRHNGHHLYLSISNVTIEWYTMKDWFIRMTSKVSGQFKYRDWNSRPFENIDFQQTCLEIVSLKLYFFVVVQLLAYKKVDGPKFKKRHDDFMLLISGIVVSISIKDRPLNHVLTLYSKIDEFNHEQIDEILKIITNEINNILCQYKIYPGKTELVDISYIDVENEVAFNSFLDTIEEQCRNFGDFLTGFSFDFLLFFINGSYNTELAIFPN
ncbi:uncharacterized protein LOC126837190 [Adelges cooleyi]|uniref:uncharacterized protein LOC126837190 n=1 Tax=Adelges cooleyi TaxID=133065 RepID=UPI0021801A5A|nr:uncharacterized protein LOC126837190 [Adelges cooleyi]